MKVILFLIFISNFVFSQTGNFKLISDGMNFPEGPALNSKGLLVVSNCNGDYLTFVENGKVRHVKSKEFSGVKFQKTNGLLFINDTTLLACDYGLGAILKINPYKLTSEVLTKGLDGNSLNRPNDLRLKSNGDLYFSDPKSYGADKLDGTLYLLRKGKKHPVPILKNIAFCNGLAFSPDERILYLCESAKSRILKLVLKEDGTVAEKSVFIVLKGGDPDGLEVDKQGNIYVAHFGGKAIYKISPKGKILAKYTTPGTKPSNLEFSNEMNEIYITECETDKVYSLKIK